MIEVWGVIKSCANVLVVLRNSPPPTKKMVRVGVIYDIACMYDILSKLEHPVIFGGQPLVFLHGPMVRDAETDPMAVSVAFGVFVPSLRTTCQSELLLKFAQIFRLLSVFEILTPQTIKITCPKKYSIRKQQQKSYRLILIPYILLMQQASHRIVPEFAGQNLNYRSFCQAEKAVGVIVDDSAWKLSSDFG